MNFFYLIGVPPWVSDSFPALQIVVISLLLALSLATVVVILMQSSTSSGMGALSGQQTETFYSKNKGRTLQGLLRRLTVVFSIAILCLTIIYFVLILIYPVNI